MTTCLDRILAPGALSVTFQPIVRRDRGCFRVQSVEALVRGPKGSTMESPAVLFEYVRRKREEDAVDRACMAAVCAEASHLPEWLPFSLNVHAATLARDPGFLPFLLDAASTNHLAPVRITVEIVEHAPQWVGPPLRKALEALRAAGLRVALDDIGLGQSNYGMLVDCRPDCFKIDAYFVRDAHLDSYRRAVLRSVAELASAVGARVVAEGVETAEELQAVLDSGIDQIQGWLFSRAVPWSELAAERVYPLPAAPRAAALLECQ